MSNKSQLYTLSKQNLGEIMESIPENELKEANGQGSFGPHRINIEYFSHYVTVSIEKSYQKKIRDREIKKETFPVP